MARLEERLGRDLFTLFYRSIARHQHSRSLSTRPFSPLGQLTSIRLMLMWQRAQWGQVFRGNGCTFSTFLRFYGTVTDLAGWISSLLSLGKKSCRILRNQCKYLTKRLLAFSPLQVEAVFVNADLFSPRRHPDGCTPSIHNETVNGK